jgi:putative ABC transport system substrate-binding protein
MRVIGLARVLAVSLVFAPLAAHGQQTGKVWRVGVLTSAVCPDEPGPGRMLSEGLRERGHTVGKTVMFECRRSDEGREERFRQLAADLVRLKLDLIIGVSSAAIGALRLATKTIPIVAIDAETDPVGSGLAVSLARPDGSITGIFLDAPEISGKRLQLLKEAVPRLARVVALWDASTDPTMLRATEMAARSLGLHLRTVTIRSPQDLESAFGTAAKEKADGVVLLGSGLMAFHLAKIADLALQRRLPTIAHFPHWAQGGVLMSYGPDLGLLYRQVASFVDRILRGAVPGELPIERPTKFELVINLKTAKALGLTIPPSVLGRADEVIQ